MSLYNAINRVSQATFFILPMLGKHPDEYPRFRDCFCQDEAHPEHNNYIHIYTRTGGGNRKDYVNENQVIRDMDGFVVDYDDSVDSTYASWIFKVPERWQDDFNALLEGKLAHVSKEYIAELKRVFPQLEAKFDSIFTQ